MMPGVDAALAAIDGMAVELGRLRTLVQTLGNEGRRPDTVPLLPAPPCTAAGPVSRIAALVAAEYDVPVQWITGDQRRRDVVEMRWLAMWLACRVGAFSTTRVGRALGHRDHTTVLHGLTKMEALLARDTALRARAGRLAAAVRGLPREGKEPTP